MTKELVHALFRCKVCDLTWANLLTAQKLGLKHATKTGHIVTGQMGYDVKYDKPLWEMR